MLESDELLRRVDSGDRLKFDGVCESDPANGHRATQAKAVGEADHPEALVAGNAHADGDDHRGGELFARVEVPKKLEDFIASALWLKVRPEGRTPADNQTVRNVFVVGPDKKIKLIIVYR